MATKVVTGKVRFSYAFLSKPKRETKADGSVVEKYTATILLPKSDKATYEALRAAEQEARQKKFPGKPAAFYSALASTIHDGDGVRPSGDEFGPECKGHWVFTVSSKDRPGIVDENTDPLLEPVNSGDYGRVSVNCYGYENSGKRGTSFGLNNVQLLERGESLSGRTDAATDFGAF